MLALNNIVAGVEQQTRSSSVRALGLILDEALVSDERTLLVTYEIANRNPASGLFAMFLYLMLRRRVQDVFSDEDTV